MDSEPRPLSPQLAEALEAMSAVLVDAEAVNGVLQLVVSLAGASMGGVDGASVSLERSGNFETASATSDEVRLVDERQYSTGEGPCVAAMRDGERHNVVLSQEREQWPTFAAEAMEHGMESMLSTPLQVKGRTIGALNLYSKNGELFGDDDVIAAQVFAEHASVVLANTISYAAAEATNQHLQTALESARMIGRAQGVLMVRQECSSDDAFDLLRRASQRTNRKLRDIAEEIVDSLDRPPPPSA